MTQYSQIAVIGLYRSGSTAAAGLLHHLGVDMGAPFWGDYYEPRALSAQLREWWNEPHLEPQVDSATRVAGLRKWIDDRAASGQRCVGCKHPLLSLCGDDLLEAWGPDTRFIWTYRPLAESIESLVRCNWWPKHAERAQKILWKAAHEFFAKTEHLRVEFTEMLDNPQRQAARIVEYLGLHPTTEQLETAVRFIQPRDHRQPARDRSRASEATEPSVGRPDTKQDGAPSPFTEKIVATILSGNNEAIIADAVRSVIDWVDEILLIDTGITDGTVEIVKQLAGGKFRQARLTWCNDFALARNTALEQASACGATWALTIDTDERLVVDGIRTLDELRLLLAGELAVQAWLVVSRGGGYAKERLIRVPSELHWKGRTHEALIGATARQRKVLPGVHFYEVAKTPETFRQKLERDLVILQEETRDKPDNARWWYYLGQTLDGLQRQREAADAYRHCATLNGWAEEAAWACYQAAKCLSSLKEFRQAIQACASGLARQPASPELAWLAAFCCFQLGEDRNAIHWEQMAIALGNVEGSYAATDRISFRHLPGWYEGPYDVLRFAYRRLGMEDAARDATEKHERAIKMRLEDHNAGDSDNHTEVEAKFETDETRTGNMSTTTTRRKVFFDLGAHYGEALRRFVTQLPLDATWEIHSFEPNPACQLAIRLRNFGLPVQVHESAVWVRDGTIAFRQQNHRAAACASPADGQSDIDGWGSCLESLDSRHPGLEPPIEVACEDLARILGSYSPDDHVVVKMDVEGAEFTILRHLIQRRVINRIKRLYVEWHVRLLANETHDSCDDLEREVGNHGVEVVRWG